MDEDDKSILSFIAGLAAGTLLGAGVALLMAPQSGARTRRHIRRAAEDITETARDRIEDASDDVRRAARDVARKAERGGARVRETVRRGVRPTD